MFIALDYDNTYTKDPKFWDEFIRYSKFYGHSVTIVTMRGPSLPIDHDCGCDVIYTGLIAKAPYMKDKGHKVDIWIDDNPYHIYYDAK